MQVSNKAVMYTISSVVVACVMIVVYGFGGRLTEERQVNGGDMQRVKTDSPQSKDFIGACSGMDVSNPEVHLLALSECMGRVRGFVDGHAVTVAMNNHVGVQSVNMWCMPAKTSTDKLLTDIMDWADANPQAYTNIRAKMNNSNGATAIIIKALRTTYPCANS